MLPVQERQKEREREGERCKASDGEEACVCGGGVACYVILESANLLIMLLMFMSENFYGCFV